MFVPPDVTPPPTNTPVPCGSPTPIPNPVSATQPGPTSTPPASFSDSGQAPGALINSAAVSCPRPYEVVQANDVTGLTNALLDGAQCSSNAQSIPFRIFLLGGTYSLSTSLHVHGDSYLIINGNGAIIQGSVQLIALLVVHDRARVVLHYVTFKNALSNQVDGPGGGYGAAIDNGGFLEVYDSRFSDNAAEHGAAAIFFSWDTSQAALVVDRVTFENNKAGGGGAIQSNTMPYVTNPLPTMPHEPVKIMCSQFKDNTANYGGAILLDVPLSTPTGLTTQPGRPGVVIDHDSFSGNMIFVPGPTIEGTDLYAFPGLGPDINIKQNYWADGAPQVGGAQLGGDLALSSGHNQSVPPLLFDPTVPQNGQYQYPQCQPAPPERLPPPTKTPTPSNTPGVGRFTNLRLKTGDTDGALRAAMFVAIYHETTNDTYYSGSIGYQYNDSGTPIPTPSTTLFDQANENYAAGFMGQSPYCQNGQDQASTDLTLVNGNIVRVEHCVDARYMYAEGILNRFIRGERAGGYDANSSYSEELMGAAFNTLSGFASTFGSSDTPPTYPLSTASCPVSDPADSTNFASSYLQIWSKLTGIDLKTLKPTNPPLTGIARIKELGFAVFWMNQWLTACKGNNSDYRLYHAFKDDIGPIIDKAITDFYNRVPDATRADLNDPNSPGAYDLKNANINGGSLGLRIVCLAVDNCLGYDLDQWDLVRPATPGAPSPTPIGGTSVPNPYTDAAVRGYYDQYPPHGCRAPSAQQPHSTNLIACLQTGRPGQITVIQPALKFEPPDPSATDFNYFTGDPSKVQGGYVWEAFVYEQLDVTKYTPRYTKNVCSIPGIQNCEVVVPDPGAIIP